MSAKTATKPASKAADKPQGAGLGLDGLGDLSSLLDDPAAANNGSAGPLELPLHLIEEDDNQPRTADNPGFSPESIGGDSAVTIKDRGVKSPISVRETSRRPKAGTSSTTVRAATAPRSWPRRKPSRLSWITTTTKPTRLSRTCNATS
jgi:hypothetical protein